MYHKACIDPWLLKHRSCPLCKQNILIACGIVLEDGLSATTSENSDISMSQHLSSSESGGSDFTVPSRLNAYGCAACSQHRHRGNHFLFCFGRCKCVSFPHHRDHRYHPRRSNDMREASLELSDGQWYPLRGLTSLAETSPSGGSSPIRQRLSPPRTIYQAARRRFSSSFSISPSSSKQNLQNQQLLCCLPWCGVWYVGPVDKQGLPSPQHQDTAPGPMQQGCPSIYLQAMQNHNTPHSCLQYHSGMARGRMFYQFPVQHVESKGGFMKYPSTDVCYPPRIGHFDLPYSSMTVKMVPPPCNTLSCVLPKHSSGASTLPSYEQVCSTKFNLHLL